MSKRIQIGLLLVFVGLYAFSQLLSRAENHNQPKTNHFAKRMAILKKQPLHLNCFIFAGNSITEGGKWEKYFSGKDVLNHGISGDVTSGLLLRTGEITRHKPYAVFIKIGINDIILTIPLESVLQNYRSVLKEVKKGSPASKIYVQSVLPVNDSIFNSVPNYKQINEDVKQLNSSLKLLAIEEGVEFIDLHPLFTDKNNQLDRKYTYDGLHLNAAGYQLWSSFLKKKYITY